MMAMFLKPTKEKILGTAGLLAADWIANAIGNWAGGLFIDTNAIKEMTPAFTQAFEAAGIMNLMIAGLVILAVGFVLKALFFYIILAYALDKAGPAEKPKKK